MDTPTPKPPKTVVMSKLEAELAVERARVEAELAIHKAERNKLTTKKIIIIVIVAVVSLALVSILFFVLTSALTGNKTTNTNPDNPDPVPGQVLPSIEGYHCTTTDCTKTADLDANQILIRDTDFYVYNRSTNKSTKTTIEKNDYRSYTPFSWGGALLLILEQSTGRQGLYSITANRAISDSYNYTSFNRDINSTAYAGMQWVEGTYILASISSETRLLDTRTGDEIVRAANRIYVDHDFIVGYEAEGQRRIYTMTGTRFLVADAPSTLMIRDHHLINVISARSFDLYDTTGTKLKTSDEYYEALRDQLRTINKDDFAAALRTMSSAFPIAD